MRPLAVPVLSAEDHQELERLYRQTRDARIRTRAQMILLAAEKQLTVSQIAAIVCENEETVRRWRKRYQVEGINGLQNAPRSGAPRKVTEAYLQQLVHVVRQRPRNLGQPYSMWTLQRLADYLAEQTGIRLEDETVRLHLKEAGIVFSRPQHTVSSPDAEYQVKKGDRRGKRSDSGKRGNCLLLCR